MIIDSHCHLNMKDFTLIYLILQKTSKNNDKMVLTLFNKNRRI